MASASEVRTLEKWKNGNLFNKTLYSLNGLRVSFMTEKAVRSEFLAAAGFVALALFWGCDFDDMFLVFLASLCPIVVELINTAVERRIDTNDGPAFREDVRIQKDTLSAAVFLSLFIAYGLCLKIIFF